MTFDGTLATERVSGIRLDIADAFYRQAKPCRDLLHRPRVGPVQTAPQPEDLPRAGIDVGQLRLERGRQCVACELIISVGRPMRYEDRTFRGWLLALRPLAGPRCRAGDESGARMDVVIVGIERAGQIGRDGPMLDARLQRRDVQTSPTAFDAVTLPRKLCVRRRQQVQQGLSNPPERMNDKRRAQVWIEATTGFDETEVAFVNQFERRHSQMTIAPGICDDEAEIRFDETGERVIVAMLAHATREILLFVRRQPRQPRDLSKVRL